MNHCAHCDNPASPGTVQLEHRRYYKDTEEDVYLVGEVGGLFVGISVDDFSVLVSYKKDGTPLEGCGGSTRLVEEVNYAPATCDCCNRPIETPEEEDEDEDMDCDHDWVRVENQAVTGTDICIKCHETKSSYIS